MEKIQLKISIYLAFCFIILIQFNIQAQTYSGGSGTKQNPWLISNNQDLIDLDTAKLQWDSVCYYLITANLDMNGETFKPIGYDNGSQKLYFKGILDGGNHVIKNLKITQHNDAAAGGNWNMGFLGLAQGAIIRNLGLDSLEISETNTNRIGGLVGHARWGCKIENSFIINSKVISTGGYIGGLIGYSEGVDIKNCVLEVEVSGLWRTGGVFGDIAWFPSSVTALSNYGTINEKNAIVGSWDGAGNLNWEDIYYKHTVTNLPGDTIGVQLTTKQMLVQDNYVGYSFDTAWTMKQDGFAVLSSFPTSAFENLEGYINVKPFADAGVSQNGQIGVLIQLDGSNSYDSNGDDLTFQWTAPAGITLSNESDTNPGFIPSAAGNYEFALVVNDGLLDSDTAKVSIAVFDNIPTDTLLNDGSWIATCSSEHWGSSASNAIDNDIFTLFSSDWTDATISFPFDFIIEMSDVSEIHHFLYVPRQDPWGPNGTVREYELYVSNSLENWGDPVSTDTFDYPNYYDGIDRELYKTERLVELNEPAHGKYLKFVSLRSVNSNLDPEHPKIELTIAELYLFGKLITVPIADAGEVQSVREGETVVLDGSGSYDKDGEEITYAWSAPDGIILSNASSLNPIFIAPMVDEETQYQFTLIVSDGTNFSVPSTVIVTVNPNLIPVAHAGDAQEVIINDTVVLNGSQSFDSNSDDSLSYIWQCPIGIKLADSTAIMPTFTAPVVNEETELEFSLIVSDDFDSSLPSNVTITVKANELPLANAGPNQSVRMGSSVNLDASGSNDPENRDLIYIWNAPEVITLDNSNSITPSFTAPMVSSDTNFRIELIVNDGIDNSIPTTVTILVLANIAPIANAGADQVVVEGTNVELDGSASSDPDSDTITYRWVSPEQIVLDDDESISTGFIAPQVNADTMFRILLTVSDEFISVTDTVKITIENETSSVEPSEQLQLSIYPNPSTGILVLESKNDGQLSINNILGKIVLMKDIYEGENILDLRTLDNGLYIFRINYKDGMSTIKVKLY